MRVTIVAWVHVASVVRRVALLHGLASDARRCRAALESAVEDLAVRLLRRVNQLVVATTYTLDHVDPHFVGILLRLLARVAAVDQQRSLASTAAIVLERLDQIRKILHDVGATVARIVPTAGHHLGLRVHCAWRWSDHSGKLLPLRQIPALRLDDWCGLVDLHGDLACFRHGPRQSCRRLVLVRRVAVHGPAVCRFYGGFACFRHEPRTILRVLPITLRATTMVRERAVIHRFPLCRFYGGFACF